MRIDSCRRCGVGMEVNKKCEICGIPIEFFCHMCSYISEKQIHSECMLKKILLAR